MQSRCSGGRRSQWKRCLFSMLLVFSSAARGFAADDPRDGLEALYRARIERIERRYEDRISSAAFFRRFRPIIEALGLPTDRQPTNLFDLSLALGDRPDLMAEFLRILESPLASSSLRRDKSIQNLAARLGSRLDRLDERLGPRPAPEPPVSSFEELFATLDREVYRVSGPYEPRSPGLVEVASYELDPISFEGLEVQDMETMSFGNYCLNDPSCQWPLTYDLLPPRMYLFWDSTLSLDEVNDIIAQDGYVMTLTVNGNLLLPGPPVGYFEKPSSPDQGYWIADGPSPGGKTGITTAIFARSVLSINDMPWHIELNVYRVEPLDIPEVIDIDQYGNPVIVDHKLIPVSYSSVTVSPNATNSQSYFDAMLYPTFQSDRCTDCHGFGTIAALAYHHNQGEAAFKESTGADLEQSAYDPTGHVIVCQSCHKLQGVDEHGNAFVEKEWKAPHEDLDVNWKTKTASQTCKRVLQNLPTSALRHTHFHGDARLFWAIEDGYVPGKVLTPLAEPGDFDEFLRRADIWNGAGAPCP